MKTTCGTCYLCEDGICQNNLCGYFKVKVQPNNSCTYMRKLDEGHVIVLGGQFTEKEIDYYVKFLKEKHKDKKIGTICLEEDENGFVLVSYEVVPDNVERFRRLPSELR